MTSYPKEKIKILFLENISDVAVKNFHKHGYEQVERINKALTEDQLAEAKGVGRMNITLDDLVVHQPVDDKSAGYLLHGG